MAQKLLNEVLEAPLFHPMNELAESDVRDVLQSDYVGATIGRGAESIVRLSPHPGYVVKVMKEGHEPSLAREWERLPTLPKCSFFSQFHGTPTWGRCLMTRLTPIPRHLFKSEHLPKFYADISAALRVLHSNDIVHADIHLNNTMLRGFPPGFVLIDLASCTGDALFPLSLGYGVQGRGGAKYSPPHESLTPPMRTAAGDYFRFAQTLIQMPEHCRKLSSFDKAPRHMRAEVDQWLQDAQLPMPRRPTSPIPEGSWRGSAVDYVLVNAGMKQQRRRLTALYYQDNHRYGNHDGYLVREPDGSEDTGSWERSAIRAKFYLVAKLKTRGSHYRDSFNEVLPFRTYSNDNGFLKLKSAVAPRPPPPPRERLPGVWADIPAAQSSLEPARVARISWTAHL